MNKKILCLITVLVITTVVSSGFALFNYDRYNTVLRKNQNLDAKISELTNQNKENEKLNKESEGNISKLKETITISESKILELEKNELKLKENISNWEQSNKQLQSKYDVLVEKIKGISNLAN
ncbi:hypothetical protein [[Clostridium] dakarense]|uniref:hypothetical protein n=1 Tax=Faecalimicrobium dakarense TaxID=1301100 RepID=UPI0004B61113|nr:hypothetical protein [[Clostridium] dakarense]